MALCLKIFCRVRFKKKSLPPFFLEKYHNNVQKNKIPKNNYSPTNKRRKAFNMKYNSY
jgi:hypothetical protein